jgi:hypothetical protein
MKKMKLVMFLGVFAMAGSAAFASQDLVQGYLHRPSEAIKCQPVSVDCDGGTFECKIGDENVRSINSPSTSCGPTLMRN